MSIGWRCLCVTTTWNLVLRRLRKICTRACTCVCVRMIKPNSTKFKTEQFLKHGQNLAGPSSRGANEERNKHASPNSQQCQAQAADAAAADAATAAEKLTKQERERDLLFKREYVSKSTKAQTSKQAGGKEQHREVPNAFLIRVRNESTADRMGRWQQQRRQRWKHRRSFGLLVGLVIVSEAAWRVLLLLCWALSLYTCQRECVNGTHKR